MVEGRCFCGDVRYRSPGPILSAVLCHCEDCQRAAGADFVAWFGLARGSVEWTGARVFFDSSPGVVRSFCERCGTPLSFDNEADAETLELYAPSLDDRTLFEPTVHLFWPERVPWLTVCDSLPKHEKGTASPVIEDEGRGGERTPR